MGDSALKPKSQPQKYKLPLPALLFIIAFAVFIIGSMLYSYVIKPAIEDSMTPVDYIYHKLGKWDKSNEKESGIVQIRGDKEKGLYLVEYNLMPLGNDDIEDEIWINTATAFICSFSKQPIVNKLSVTINIPYYDEYKNVTWKPYISFDLNRDTLAEMNAKNVTESDLLTIADNVKHYK